MLVFDFKRNTAMEKEVAKLKEQLRLAKTQLKVYKLSVHKI